MIDLRGSIPRVLRLQGICALHVPSLQTGTNAGQLGIGSGVVLGQSPSFHALHLPLRTAFAAATYAGAADAAIASDPQSLPHATPWIVTQSVSTLHARDADRLATSSVACADARSERHAPAEM